MDGIVRGVNGYGIVNVYGIKGFTMIMSIYPIERQLDIIGHKYEEAKSLFTKIYDEYVESDEFQQWATRKSNCHIDEHGRKVSVG